MHMMLIMIDVSDKNIDIALPDLIECRPTLSLLNPNDSAPSNSTAAHSFDQSWSTLVSGDIFFD